MIIISGISFEIVLLASVQKNTKTMTLPIRKRTRVKKKKLKRINNNSLRLCVCVCKSLIKEKQKKNSTLSHLISFQLFFPRPFYNQFYSGNLNLKKNYSMRMYVCVCVGVHFFQYMKIGIQFNPCIINIFIDIHSFILIIVCELRYGLYHGQTLEFKNFFFFLSIFLHSLKQQRKKNKSSSSM